MAEANCEGGDPPERQGVAGSEKPSLTFSQVFQLVRRSPVASCLESSLPGRKPSRLASVHKDLRLCDLCKELGFRTQRADRKNSSSYNSFAFSMLCRQFLERCCCEMSASASRRDNTDRSLARSAWESVPRKNRPVGYGMIGR